MRRRIVGAKMIETRALRAKRAITVRFNVVVAVVVVIVVVAGVSTENPWTHFSSRF